MLTEEYVSPCGSLLLGVRGSGLCLCDWMADGRIEKTLGRIQKFLPLSVETDNPDIIAAAGRQLDEYFAGSRKVFDVPLYAYGSDFRRIVWEAIRQIPFASTVSYMRIAEMIGRSDAVRAVANAVGSNPLSIFIPCHRIVGADGSLTGYAGGMEAKRYLLNLEEGQTN